MANRYCVEALDRTLRDILRITFTNAENKSFGGISVVLGGDLRQILSVVPKGRRADIVNASIKRAYLWDYFELLNHEIVDKINNFIMDLIEDEELIYYSSDSVSNTKSAFKDPHLLYPTEFLNSLKFSGIPDHELKLKVGIPLILLRNINQSIELCNGTRLIILRLGKWFIEAEIITGSNIGDKNFFIENCTIAK
ncbi:ATP-dependent DNA helicase PIF1-like [Canna indica]|uniref:ATP-dependent DNA helicase n=1 Tax=Canna indica TaxID=4628 RepID=A0AAQ3K485_9LILI|nr:ATP-dependent DNA helicase PIF1-like [Canna indica]